MSQSNALSVSIRINRHMLGCKFICCMNCCGPAFELIDTCWDVNAVFVYKLVFNVLELIDTCWDVNVKDCAATTLVLDELIDTCWDVNSLEDAKSDCIK